MATMGNAIQGQTGELRMTIQVKRAATGKVEEYELVGRCTDDEAEQLGLKEKQHDGNALDSK